MTLFEFFERGLANHYIIQNAETITQTKTVIIMVSAILLTIIISYLLGSINFAIVISSRKYNQDIRAYGSKNAGMTNMVRTYGKKMGALTLVGDALKAVIACLVGYALFGIHGAYIAAIGCIVGHMFPIFFGFKGGKGVATAAFAMLMTNPLVFIICIVLFVLIVLMSKYISLASVTTMLIYPYILYGIDSLAFGYCPYVPYALLMSVLIMIKHKDNIKRLRNGTENKFSLKKKALHPEENHAEPSVDNQNENN